MLAQGKRSAALGVHPNPPESRREGAKLPERMINCLAELRLRFFLA